MTDVDELVAIWNRHKGRMRKLKDGEIEPSSDNETEFLKFIKGSKTAETVYEQAWQHFTRLQNGENVVRVGKRYLGPGWNDYAGNTSPYDQDHWKN